MYKVFSFLADVLRTQMTQYKIKGFSESVSKVCKQNSSNKSRKYCPFDFSIYFLNRYQMWKNNF